MNFSQSRIITPQGALLKPFYREMQDIFPYDRPVYDALIEFGDSFYPMQNYALYQGDTLLGNAGIMPFRIWQSGKWNNIYGIGAVAVMPEYRKQGVASRLLEYCLSLIDTEKKPSALFTELEVVYRPRGFHTVLQNYRSVAVNEKSLDFKTEDFRIINTLNSEDMVSVSMLYHSSPEYTGKVLRDELYWEFYRMMFNPYEKPEIVFFNPGGKDEGYARYEIESDRITITELSCPRGKPELMGNLFTFINEKSRKAGFTDITIALSPDHAIWDYLEDNKVVPAEEPAGVRRESFMMRPAAGGGDSIDSSLFWSLSDKF